MPQLEGLFARDLLKNEAHAVGEAAQGQVFLVLNRQGVEDLLLNDRESILHIVHRVVHDLRKLGNQLSLRWLFGLSGSRVLNAIAQSLAERWYFLGMIDKNISKLVVFFHLG